MNHRYSAPLLLCLALFCSFFVYTQRAEMQSSTSAFAGYAWSENIGWIDTHAWVINPDWTFSGYAWSENIGFISANPSDIAGCPLGTCRALVASDGLHGWVRALAGGVPESGGWDGWIRLDGVHLNPDNTLSGYAWGGNVVGWVDFSKVSITGGGPRPPSRVDGGWSDWSPCDSSCRQTRVCDNPTPVGGGASCVDSSPAHVPKLSETQMCLNCTPALLASVSFVDSSQQCIGAVAGSDVNLQWNSVGWSSNSTGRTCAIYLDQTKLLGNLPESGIKDGIKIPSTGAVSVSCTDSSGAVTQNAGNLNLLWCAGQASLSVDRTVVRKGDMVTLTWGGDFVTSCTLTGDDGYTATVSANAATGKVSQITKHVINARTIFNVSCMGVDGTEYTAPSVRVVLVPSTREI